METRNRKPKVAYLIADTGKKYGIEKYDEFLLEELDKLVDISLFKLPYRGTLGSLIRSRKAIRDIAKRGYDLYHTSNNTGVLLKQLGLPSIFTVHHPSSCFADYLEMDKRRVGIKARLLNFFRYRAEKVCLDHARFVIAISEFTKKVLADGYGVSPDKIAVINDGLDHKLFSPAQRREEIRNTYQAKEIIFYCGRLESDKNLERSILAIKKLKESGKESFVFLIAGSGAQEKYLKRLVARLDLRDTVNFLGRVPDEELPAYYASSDIFLNPSLLEGFGMTNVEAMASGLPVISSKMEPTTEVVDDHGFLVNPLDVTGIHDALRRVLQDKNLRDSFREKGLERAQDYSWQKSATLVSQVYQRALSSTKPTES